MDIRPSSALWHNLIRSSTAWADKYPLDCNYMWESMQYLTSGLQSYITDKVCGYIYAVPVTLHVIFPHVRDLHNLLLLFHIILCILIQSMSNRSSWNEVQQDWYNAHFIKILIQYICVAGSRSVNSEWWLSAAQTFTTGISGCTISSWQEEEEQAEQYGGPLLLISLRSVQINACRLFSHQWSSQLPPTSAQTLLTINNIPVFMLFTFILAHSTSMWVTPTLLGQWNTEWHVISVIKYSIEYYSFTSPFLNLRTWSVQSTDLVLKDGIMLAKHLCCNPYSLV